MSSSLLVWNGHCFRSDPTNKKLTCSLGWNSRTAGWNWGLPLPSRDSWGLIFQPAPNYKRTPSWKATILQDLLNSVVILCFGASLWRQVAWRFLTRRLEMATLQIPPACQFLFSYYFCFYSLLLLFLFVCFLFLSIEIMNVLVPT